MARQRRARHTTGLPGEEAVGWRDERSRIFSAAAVVANCVAYLGRGAAAAQEGRAGRPQDAEAAVFYTFFIRFLSFGVFLLKTS